MDPKIKELFVQMLILIQESADSQRGLISQNDLTAHIAAVKREIDDLSTPTD